MDDTQIKKLYDGFEKKDMPLAQFTKELKALMDPNLMVKDAKAMAETKGLLKVKN